jgi:leader peptidase (prepilin peptidase)/N-methyltransferase
MTIPMIIWLVLVFCMGASVGSFMNVCIYRLPLEKSVFWPGSHCGSCIQAIHWRDNIPILGYLLLGGKCRKCNSPYSIRYMLVELAMGLIFSAVFYLNTLGNLLAFDFVQNQKWQISHGVIPWQIWVMFISQSVVISLLITASLTDIDCMEIPLGITITGTILGLVFSAFQPWPFPENIGDFLDDFYRTKDWPLNPLLPRGATPWPPWFPLDNFPDQPWLKGLLQGIIGALAGTFLVRIVRFTFGLGRGMEGMGLGDADLMMMVGAFWGWQLVVVAFFLSVLPAFFFGLLQLFSKGEQAFPFGPSLAISSIVCFYAWPYLAKPTQMYFFEPLILIFLSTFGVISLFLISLILRFLRPIDKSNIS